MILAEVGRYIKNLFATENTEVTENGIVKRRSDRWEMHIYYMEGHK